MYVNEDLRCKQEPLSHRVSEEDQLDKVCRILRPAGNDKRQEQTSVLSDQIITDLSHEQQRQHTKSFTHSPLLVRRIVPDQRHMAQRSLSPALCPSHALFPECSKVGRCHLIRQDVHIVNGLLAFAVCTQC